MTASHQTVRASGPLRFGGRTFQSRMIVGTGKYADFETMRRAHEASGAEIVTVAIRRVNLEARGTGQSLLDHVDTQRFTLLPNTAGCYTVKDAVLTAQLAREALGTELIKLEVIGDEKTLFPDNEGLLEASRILVKEGFTVLPYDRHRSVQEAGRRGARRSCPRRPDLLGLGIRNPTTSNHPRDRESAV
jgi:thiazole synthase